MSYTLEDAERDAAWDALYEELYPEHRDQAIDEFTTERLQSYYLKNPEVLQPGILKFKEANKLFNDHPSAALVFYATAIEIFLKASLLKPVVYGLVHNDSLAEIIMDTALGQSGFDRYKKLLSKLFDELVGVDISKVQRQESSISVLVEASEVQSIRNHVIHKGATVTSEQAEFSQNVASAVLFNIVQEMLEALGLQIGHQGVVKLQ